MRKRAALPDAVYSLSPMKGEKTMKTSSASKLRFSIDPATGDISSLRLDCRELLHAPSPLFRMGLRDRKGGKIVLTAHDAARRRLGDACCAFDSFPLDFSVRVTFGGEEKAEWGIRVDNRTDAQVEWVEFPCLTVEPLRENGGDARIVYPYNEGALIEDIHRHTYREPDYPSYASFDMFPNMVCSQFLLYLTEGRGLYFAAHDPARGVKQISFYEDRGGVALQIRGYCGLEPGESYESPYPCVLRAFEGDWQEGAELYRAWFQAHLPAGLKPSAQSGLPAWYWDTPLVVSYPVRGVHDTDVMTPNALFPYSNALLMLDKIAERFGGRLLVLLMHWEGTAPWAPPYVWPPFGGEKCFNAFADQLHSRGHMLGVYCSGFGYTIQSNLVEDYDCREAFEREGLRDVMCAGPKGEVTSTVCTAQRFGYDICVHAPGAEKLLNEAYGPLLQSRIDYAQILDQNHGGGQYFCYSPSHGHAPAPGPWMTESMCRLLAGWREKGNDKLLGCESAAGEAFLSYLRFSDNRFELNWHSGEPVPLYAFLYHEYLRNFMGNQVSCGLSNEEDTLRYRMAYSFAAGDCMTLVFAPDGRLFNSWGDHDFSRPAPDPEKTLDFAANMRAFLERGAAEYLTDGRMIAPLPVACAQIRFHRAKDHSEVMVPAVVSSAWIKNGRKAQLLINHTDEEQTAETGGKILRIPPRDAVLIPIGEEAFDTSGAL